MPYQVWMAPNGKHADREHVQSYPDATKATPDIEYLRRLLPAKDVVSGDWTVLTGKEKKFDWSRCREQPNVPGEGAETTGG